ncbi:MAG: MauE/DoxX family redox-associated membrane protein [Rhizobiaceae bacterium]
MQAQMEAKGVADQSAGRRATLYRMVMHKHLCPFGLKSKALLESRGFEVEDHWLESRDETERFKEEHGVETTPQTFIGGQRIGGYDDLRIHFGDTTPGEDETSYQPVIAIFATSALIALAMSWFVFGAIFTTRAAEWFIAVSMCVLAIQKLQDLESFSTMFLNYDLLAQRWVRYAYLYPFGEALAGILMIAGALIWLAAPVALIIGTIGAVSVVKAVYVDRRELKCACVGGSSRVPLGFVSLTENLMMIAMAIWMGTRALL